jgi:TonB-dependent SusC/RagA subfamily outer membrane receptor
MHAPARWIVWSVSIIAVAVPLSGTRARGQGPDTSASDTSARRRPADSVPSTSGWLPRYQAGASIGTIRADSIVRTAPITQFTDLLTARLAGVDVQSGGGMSGSGARIIIRGGGSLASGSDPVVYLDGIRINGDPPRFVGAVPAIAPTATTGPLAGGRLEDLSADEIERVDVLTGPAATTRYGIDAWNGVVLVTTKRPSSATAEWSAFAEEGMLTPPPPRVPDSYYGWGHTTGSPSMATACDLQARASGSCVQDSVTHFSPLSDRATTPLANGYRDHYGLQVGGSAGPGRYFLSGDRQSETGILEMPAPDVQLFSAEDGGPPLPGQVRPNSLDRTNLRATLGADIGSRADITIFGNAIGGDHRTTDDPELAEAVAYGSGSPGADDGWLSGFMRPRTLFANENTDRIWRDILGGALTWRILDGLTAHMTAGIDHADGHSIELIHGIDAAAEGLSDGTETDANLVTNEQTGDADVSGVLAVGNGWSTRTTLGVQLRDEGEADRGRIVVGNGIETSSTFQESSARQRGGYVEETLSEADRFSVTAALRAEGPVGLFGKATEGLPRFAVSWTPVEHDGDALHVHAAYGRTSNLPVAAAFYFPLQATTTGPVVPTASEPVPEFTTEYEAGIDADILRERVTIGGSAYDRTIDHMSFEVSTNPAVGFGEEILSTGIVRNRGAELSVAVVAIRAPALSWDVHVNVWTNASRVITLYPGAAGLTVPSLFVAPIYRVVPGASLYSIWEPNLTYHDQNGDGIIEPDEVTLSNPVNQGSSLPTRGVTLQNGVGFLGGRLRIGVLADYQGGNRLVDPVLSYQYLFGTSRGSVDPHAPLAEQAQAVAATEPSYAGPAQDASFVRLRELSMTVSGTPSIARALRTRSVALSLLARNLWLWTPYKGTDPEINTNNNADPVLGYTVVPLPRYFIARVTLGY